MIFQNNHVTNVSSLMQKDACVTSSSPLQAQSARQPDWLFSKDSLGSPANFQSFLGRCFVINQDNLHHLGH